MVAVGMTIIDSAPQYNGKGTTSQHRNFFLILSHFVNMILAQWRQQTCSGEGGDYEAHQKEEGPKSCWFWPLAKGQIGDSQLVKKRWA